MINPFKSKINESAAELLALQESFNTLNESFATLTADFKNSSEMQATLASENSRLDEANKALTAELETLKAQEAQVAQDKLKVDELAAMKAAEILAASGAPQVEIIEEVKPEDNDAFDISNLVKEFKSKSGSELQEFYNKNKTALNKAFKSHK